jgi:hypothetical protein
MLTGQLGLEPGNLTDVAPLIDCGLVGRSVTLLVLQLIRDLVQPGYQYALRQGVWHC